MTWGEREPTLQDILSDPITKEVMKADGVDSHQLSAMLKAYRRNYRMLRSSTGRLLMRKISLCAIAAAMVAIGFGVWNASTGARVVAPPLGQGIDPHQMMMNTKGLATAEFVDYTFVFH